MYCEIMFCSLFVRYSCASRNIKNYHMDILKYLCLNYSHVQSSFSFFSSVSVCEPGTRARGYTLCFSVCVCLHMFSEEGISGARMAKCLSSSNWNLELQCEFLGTACLLGFFLSFHLFSPSYHSHLGSILYSMRLCTVKKRKEKKW